MFYILNFFENAVFDSNEHDFFEKKDFGYNFQYTFLNVQYSKDKTFLQSRSVPTKLNVVLNINMLIC